VWGLVGGIFGVVTILILTFYLLVDFDPIVRTFIRLFPQGERPRASDATMRVVSKVSAWLGGQLLLAAIIGSSAALGLWLMGVPYFYVLALIAAVGEMIPVIGPVLSAIPALLVALTVSPTLALFVLVFFFFQQQLENHILVPKIMERQVGISAVVVISALLIGGSLLGIVGALLAVPSAAILQVLFEELAPSE
jgi:predicted PurR-regulated permease PerM